MIEKIIQFKKSFLLFSIFINILYVLGGVWIFLDMMGKGYFMLIPSIIFLSGVILSVIIISFSNKLFDNKPGLIINEKGIFDNSSPIAIGFIPWDDIQEIGQRKNIPFLLINVKNPNVYLKKGNFITKKINKVIYEKSGTPIHINPLFLNINKYKELVFIVKTYFNEYGQKS